MIDLNALISIISQLASEQFEINQCSLLAAHFHHIASWGYMPPALPNMTNKGKDNVNVIVPY